MSQYIAYPLVGEGIQTYSTFSAFPSSAADGTVALALDTNNLYVYDTGTVSWVLIASPHDLIDTLTDSHIFVGSAANIATDRAMSGDITIGNTGITVIGAARVTNAMLAGSIDLTTKVTGALPLLNGGTGTAAASANAAFNVLSPLTTKGDVLGYSTVNARLGVGADGTVLTADNASSLGIKWSAAAAGTVTSVALSVPAASILTVTGSPVTTSGTLGLVTTGTSGGIPYFSSTSALSTSALLAANQIILGGGAATTPATLGSLGTTTTVLHGNAAGAPTFGAVSLTADVSGALPLINGGTGTAAASANAAFNALSPMTTSGDIIYGGTSGAGTRLAKGSDTQVLTLAAGIPSWASPALSLAAVGSSPNANGATVSGLQLTLQPASSSQPGLVSTAAQTLAGAKTFSSGIVIGNNSTGDSNLGTIVSVTNSSYYDGTFSYSFDGAGFSSTQVVTVQYVKIGKMVHLTFPQTIATTGGASASITGTAAIPTGLRPSTANDMFFCVQTYDNAIYTNGAAQIGTGGVVSIYRAANLTTTFTAAAVSIGWVAFGISYKTA